MRKRLIGKAFAVAMAGAMAFTAAPATANIFNVAHIVKAAEADQAQEWTYCYVGLTWAEYWANEGVYNADNTTSSSITDDHGEYDKGGYDVVTRATTNHGLHRGSFQSSTVIEATEVGGTKTKEFTVSHWSADGKTLYQSANDTTGVAYSKGDITDTDGTVYHLNEYHVSGVKYVPVKVKTADLAALKASHKVVENGETMVGGYSENKLSAYTETANVTANTHGLKTAKKQADGSFTFSARSTEGTDSGIKNKTLKTATATPNLRSGADVGSFGEAIRLDFNGDYGDLGSNMQAVKWTYYGNDASRKNVVRTFGTKFASDNWMHKSMGIQLGLTDSFRYELPEGYDGTGYWTVTIYALGYEDYSTDIEVTKDNIAVPTIAQDEDKDDLRDLVEEAEPLTKLDKSEYCDSEKAFSDLTSELDETKDIIANESASLATVKEQSHHLSEAIETVKALSKHDYKNVVTPATTSKDGSIDNKCANCDDVKSSTPIAKIASIALSKTSYTENGKAQKPSVVVKDSAKKTIGSGNYTVTYSNSKSTNPGTYKVTVKFKGNYSGSKTLSYKITAAAPAKTTVTLSSAKKTSLKASWKKVSKASAYEVQYSTSKSFKGAKTVKVSSKSSSKVLTKLTKNKKYYVRVRAVRTLKVDNKNTTLRASWSSAKSLTTKKK